MTEQELLEAAAKAVNSGAWHPLTHDTPNGVWNPLADDGDALRLAVALEMCIGIAPHPMALDKVSLALAPGGKEVSCKHDGNPAAATRRAIVCAAAAMAA